MNEETTVMAQPSTAAKNGSAHQLVQSENVRKASRIIRAVNHPLRQTLLNLINTNQTMNVTDIYVKLRIEQSVASQHLAILRAAEVVKTKREGKQIFYAINHNRLAHINKCSSDLVNR